MFRHGPMNGALRFDNKESTSGACRSTISSGTRAHADPGRATAATAPITAPNRTTPATDRPEPIWDAAPRQAAHSPRRALKTAPGARRALNDHPTAAC